jgi:hypothetical protein
MSFEEVKMSYHNSINPSKHIITKIEGLIEFFPKEVLEKRKLLHLLNVISTKNKKHWVTEFNKIVKNKWKTENNYMLASIIIKQNLYTDIYIEMLSQLKKSDKAIVIDKILSEELKSNEKKIVGIFFGKWFINLNMCKENIEQYCKNRFENRNGILIPLLITITNLESKLMPMNVYKGIDTSELTTNDLMAYYDLEELVEIKNLL